MARTTNTRTSSARTAKQRLEDIEVKATVVDEPTTPEAEHAAWANFEAARDALFALYGGCSVRRYIVSAVCGFAAAFCASYAIGSLTTMLMAAALTFTGSAFLSLVFGILGTLLALAAGWYAGSAAFDYVITKKVDAHIGVAKAVVLDVKNSVTKFFGFGTPKAA